VIRAERLAEQRAGAGATVMERLLADQVATNWRHPYALELPASKNITGDLRVTQRCQRVLTLAQRRYFASLGLLPLVRKLAGSRLQVHIGPEQADVAGGRDTLPMPAPSAALGPVEAGREGRGGGREHFGKPHEDQFVAFKDW
jgi:hypothetical protein